MKIKRLGSYQGTDEHGYLEKLADISKLQPEWTAALEALKKAYLDTFGDAIHSIYVRGSVAKGKAVKGVSDLDSIAVTHESKDPGEIQNQKALEDWWVKLENDITERHAHVAGIEVSLTPFETATDSSRIEAFIIKMEGVCIYGDDLAEKLPGYKLGPAVMFQTRHFHEHLPLFLENYPQEPEEEKPEFVVWMMRRFLRLGMELVMERERRYTRDLYLCYESFINHYPDQQGSMYRALELAVNPVATAETLAFVERFGGWLADEAQRALEGS